MLSVFSLGLLSAFEVIIILCKAQPYHDPFVPYQSIMPGQPPDALKQFACDSYRDEEATTHCIFSLTDGPFDSVHVAYDKTIKSVRFMVHPGSLHLSDLLGYWGNFKKLRSLIPKFRTGFVNIDWDNQNYAIVIARGYNRHLPGLVPVYEVSIGE
jgi:hypothetical protein